eukprot:maker-scaffold_9-snap-gene-3.33-mRNA-1 protein AED:0.00 eAED:0.00 QI:19/1/1/1/0/0/2/45/681
MKELLLKITQNDAHLEYILTSESQMKRSNKKPLRKICSKLGSMADCLLEVESEYEKELDFLRKKLSMLSSVSAENKALKRKLAQLESKPKFSLTRETSSLKRAHNEEVLYLKIKACRAEEELKTLKNKLYTSRDEEQVFKFDDLALKNNETYSSIDISASDFKHAVKNGYTVLIRNFLQPLYDNKTLSKGSSSSENEGSNHVLREVRRFLGEVLSSFILGLDRWKEGTSIDLGVFDLLLRARPPIKSEDLHHLCSKNRFPELEQVIKKLEPTMRYLLNKECNTRDGKLLPLETCVKHDSYSCAKLLLENGCQFKKVPLTDGRRKFYNPNPHTVVSLFRDPTVMFWNTTKQGIYFNSLKDHSNALVLFTVAIFILEKLKLHSSGDVNELTQTIDEISRYGGDSCLKVAGILKQLDIPMNCLPKISDAKISLSTLYFNRATVLHELGFLVRGLKDAQVASKLHREVSGKTYHRAAELEARIHLNLFNFDSAESLFSTLQGFETERKQASICRHASHYQVLGVQPRAGEDEIKRNFKKMSLRFHPDKNNLNEEDKARAENMIGRINEARTVLLDRNKRIIYDAERRTDYSGSMNWPWQGTVPTFAAEKREREEREKVEKTCVDLTNSSDSEPFTPENDYTDKTTSRGMCWGGFQKASDFGSINLNVNQKSSKMFSFPSNEAMDL